jgi:hypothetical protein
LILGLKIYYKDSKYIQKVLTSLIRIQNWTSVGGDEKGYFTT